MPFGRFCLYTFLGSIPWCLGLAYLGYQAGDRWKSLQTYFHKFDVVILAAFAAGVIWWVWRHVRQEAGSG
jgi:membrane protein DedA with SNARE-associated domain